MTTDRKMRVREAALYLGLGKSTLDKMRVTGDGPPYYRIGPARRIVVYDRGDLDAWVAAGRQRSTGEAA
ncbi:MAG TPA: helix-turn-helix domain-containing protein [Stellaceae bacterium]|jgi:excisionase family DNA binding protein|nr:helix-turn-helix domain-containing protein [Stellaceae bacterium]